MIKPYKYDFSKSNKLEKQCKFVICHLNSKYNESNQTWTIELPRFFTDNGPDFRQIRIEQFTYFRPDGTSDIGTTFHSEDLFDGSYSQPELDYFVGVAANSINGLYTLQSRRRTLTFWFKDYYNIDEKYGAVEEYTDYIEKTQKTGEVRFFIQCTLYY